MPSGELSSRELDAYLAEHLFGRESCWMSERAQYVNGETSAHRYLVYVDEGSWGPEVHLYSSTGEGMLKVIEAMRERGYDCLTWRWQHQDCSALFAHPHDLDRHFLRGTRADTLPRAVAEAARAAIEAEA